MKQFQMIVLFIFLLIFISPKSYAQDEWSPCVPYCTDVTWTPNYPEEALETTINLCGKSIKIRYRFRHACNHYDYYLEAVEGDRDCLSQYGNHMDYFINSVVEALILKNPANFPPHDTGECNTDFRIVKGNCWVWDTVLGLGGPDDPGAQGEVGYPHTIPYYDPIIWPCTSANCCVQVFRVCILSSGMKVITETHYLPPAFSGCGETGSGTEFWNCQPVCGTNADTSLPPPGD